MIGLMNIKLEYSFHEVAGESVHGQGEFMLDIREIIAVKKDGYRCKILSRVFSEKCDVPKWERIEEPYEDFVKRYFTVLRGGQS